MAEPQKKTPPRMLEVIETRSVSPHIKRVSLGGAELEGLRGWPAAHIKLFLPRPHQDVPVLPTLDANGRPVWPALPERPITRTYSLRRHDPLALRLEVDFVLHEPQGPASAWAEAAKPGDRIGLAGPGGPEPLVPRAPHARLAGDLSALPAIGALLEAMPEDAHGDAFIEVPEAADMQSLSTPPNVTVHWLITGERDLVDVVQQAPWPGPDTFVWLAGEARQVVALRDFMRGVHGVPVGNLYAVPYWKRRETEEQYHEERHRVMDELAAEGA